MIICVVAQYVKTGIYSLDATIEGINDYAQTWWLPIVGIVIGLIIGAVFRNYKAKDTVKIGRRTTVTYNVIFINGLTQYLMHWKPN